MLSTLNTQIMTNLTKGSGGEKKKGCEYFEQAGHSVRQGRLEGCQEAKSSSGAEGLGSQEMKACQNISCRYEGTRCARKDFRPFFAFLC
jgi:hypothetical protein